MRLIRVLIVLSVFSGCLVSLTMAKTEYSKKEGKSCTFCHAKVEAKDAMNNNLTDAGKYYKDHNHSLEGYKAPEKK